MYLSIVHILITHIIVSLSFSLKSFMSQLSTWYDHQMNEWPCERYEYKYTYYELWVKSEMAMSFRYFFSYRLTKSIGEKKCNEKINFSTDHPKHLIPAKIWNWRGQRSPHSMRWWYQCPQYQCFQPFQIAASKLFSHSWIYPELSLFPLQCDQFGCILRRKKFKW